MYYRNITFISTEVPKFDQDLVVYAVYRQYKDRYEGFARFKRRIDPVMIKEAIGAPSLEIFPVRSYYKTTIEKYKRKSGYKEFGSLSTADIRFYVCNAKFRSVNRPTFDTDILEYYIYRYIPLSERTDVYRWEGFVKSEDKHTLEYLKSALHTEDGNIQITSLGGTKIMDCLSAIFKHGDYIEYEK